MNTHLQFQSTLTCLRFAAYHIHDGDGSIFGTSGPPGSGEAEAEFTRYFGKIAKVNHTMIEVYKNTCYGPFAEAGIAAGAIECGADGIKTEEEARMFGGTPGVQYDVNYHRESDTVENLNYNAWMVMTRAIAHMTATYARSFDGLPSKNLIRIETL